MSTWSWLAVRREQHVVIYLLFEHDDSHAANEAVLVDVKVRSTLPDTPALPALLAARQVGTVRLFHGGTPWLFFTGYPGGLPLRIGWADGSSAAITTLGMAGACGYSPCRIDLRDVGHPLLKRRRVLHASARPRRKSPRRR